MRNRSVKFFGVDVRAVIFDFDGVIINSSMIKHDIFLSLAGEIDTDLKRELDAALRKELVGAERKKVANWICGKVGADASMESRLLERFAQLLEEQLNSVELVPGILELTERLRNCRVPMGIVSAAPSSDIKNILSRLNVDVGFYKTILGSDHGSKTKSCAAFVKENGNEPDNTFLFGDMPSDYAVANKLSLNFVKVESPAGAICDWSNHAFSHSIKDFNQLMELMKN